jgi:hypothetical protein
MAEKWNNKVLTLIVSLWICGTIFFPIAVFKWLYWLWCRVAGPVLQFLPLPSCVFLFREQNFIMRATILDVLAVVELS